MTSTLSRRVSVPVAILIALVLVAGDPSTAYAADGQMIGGDGNVASHVVDGGTHGKVTFDVGSIVKDCATGLSSCSVEYRWRSKKNCATCWWATNTNWVSLPTGATQATFCPGTGSYQMELQVRLRWSATTTKTVETWGKYESRYDIGVSSLVTRLIASAHFNKTNNAGFKGTVKLETNTATSDYGDPYTIATSGGAYISTSC